MWESSNVRLRPDTPSRHVSTKNGIDPTVALILATTASASPWSFSARAGRGQIIGNARAYSSNPRFALDVSLLHALTDVFGVGLDVSWWEELGSQGFAYGDQGPNDPNEEHQREIAAAALVRARASLMYSRPYLLLGVGSYLATREDRYPGDRSNSTREYAPGWSIGVGIASSTRPAPLLEARWHRLYTHLNHFDSSATTNVLIIAAGLSFN